MNGMFKKVVMKNVKDVGLSQYLNQLIKEIRFETSSFYL